MDRSMRERRFDETREAILASAAEVLNARGFEKATTREIARSAGVAEGTLYTHFRNKRDILLTLVRGFAEKASGLFYEKLDETVESGADVPGIAARFFFERLRFFRDGLSPTLIFYHAKRDAEVRGILEHFLVNSMDELLRKPLKRLIRAGTMRSMDADFLVDFMRSMVFGLAVLMDLGAFETREPTDPEVMSRMARDVIWYGLSARKEMQT